MHLLKLFSGKWPLAMAVAALWTVSACASTQTAQTAGAADEINDPIEPVNRYIFEVNYFLDEVVIKPVTWWYRAALPDPAQRGVSNALSNLRMPWTAINDVLQGEFSRAWTATARFLINSTFGIAGLFEVASDWGFPKHEEDAGQTLGVWGVGEGFYLVLPVFGPSSARDAIGLAADWFLDPVNVVAWSYEDGDVFVTARSGLSAVDYRNQTIEPLDDLRRTSVDYYAAIRSVYRQRRAAEIRNGADAEDLPRPGLTRQ
jgi:phospholipid-binding lipoprotein MlaA